MHKKRFQLCTGNGTCLRHQSCTCYGCMLRLVSAASRDRSLMILYEVRTSCIMKRLSLTFDSLRWRYLKKIATLFKTIFISNGKR